MRVVRPQVALAVNRRAQRTQLRHENYRPEDEDHWGGAGPCEGGTVGMAARPLLFHSLLNHQVTRDSENDGL